MSHSSTLFPLVDPKSQGVIYIMTNPAFESYVKIGYADDLAQRLNDLNRTECVPFGFRVYGYYEVEKRLMDKKIHEIFDVIDPERRSVEEVGGKTRKREFFNISARDAYTILESIAAIHGYEHRLHLVNITEAEAEEEQIAEDNRSNVKRSPTRFSWLNIEKGSVLHYVNDPTITCTVVDDRRVEYQGQITSLSNIAEKLLNRNSANGFLYFTYNGRVIDELRTEYDMNH